MADASLQTGFTKIYQFLAQQGDWKAQADTNGDGYVLKSEFTNFMEGFTWDENGTGIKKDDLVSNFFASIDTKTAGRISDCSKFSNKNALTKTEQEKLQVKIDAYTYLDTFFDATDLNCPSFITNKSAWENSIYDSLVNTMETTYLKTASTHDEAKLNEIFEKALPVAKNKATADYYAYEFMDSTYVKDMLAEAGLADYAYSADNELGKLISAYISTLQGADGEEAEIEAMVTAIIENYLSTANLCTFDETIELDSKFKTSTDESAALNEIQKMRIQKKIISDLEGIKTSDANYETYKELYETAFTEFVAAEIATAKNGGFSELLATDFSVKFQDSDAHTKLANTIIVKKAMEGESLQQLIAEDATLQALTSLQEKLATDSRYLSALKTVEAAAIEKAANGDFDTNGVFDETKLNAYIIDQLKANIESFYTSGMNGMTLAELNAVYDILAEAANSPDLSDEESLKAHRNAALKYCNAVANKNKTFAGQVKLIFGDNYSTAINSMYPSELQAKIEELKEACGKLGDASEVKFANGLWTDFSDSKVSVVANSNVTRTIGKNFEFQTTDGKTISKDRISFKSSNPSIASVDGNGTVSFSNTLGTYTVSLQVLVDGVAVDTKDITITIIKQLDRASVDKVYTAETVELSGFGRTKGTGFQDRLISNLEPYINNLANILKSAGYDAAQVDKAAETTKNYYNEFIRTLDVNDDKSNTNTFTYTDANGNSVTTQMQYTKNTHRKEKNCTTKTDATANTSSGIALGESYAGKDTYNAYINMSVVVDKFLGFFNTI